MLYIFLSGGLLLDDTCCCCVIVSITAKTSHLFFTFIRLIFTALHINHGRLYELRTKMIAFEFRLYASVSSSLFLSFSFCLPYLQSMHTHICVIILFFVFFNIFNVKTIHTSAYILLTWISMSKLFRKTLVRTRCICIPLGK